MNSATEVMANVHSICDLAVIPLRTFTARPRLERASLPYGLRELNRPNGLFSPSSLSGTVVDQMLAEGGPAIHPRGFSAASQRGPSPYG